MKITTFAERLRSLMDERGMTNDDMVRAYPTIGSSALLSWLAGARTPRARRMNEICRALNAGGAHLKLKPLKPDDLINGIDVPFRLRMEVAAIMATESRA